MVLVNVFKPQEKFVFFPFFTISIFYIEDAENCSKVHNQTDVCSICHVQTLLCCILFKGCKCQSSVRRCITGTITIIMVR